VRKKRGFRSTAKVEVIAGYDHNRSGSTVDADNTAI
jgi:hypothetical protein